MPFLINPNCKCCSDILHHCLSCWNQFHNGEKHKDYEPPEFYGQSMIKEELQKKMKEEYGIEFDRNIKPDKNRKYKEGEYH